MKIDTYLDRSLYRELIAAGYPESEIDHHESDMYVYVTPLTTRLVREFWPDDDMRGIFVKTFTDNVTRRPMYDVAFAYDPYWQERTEGR